MSAAAAPETARWLLRALKRKTSLERTNAREFCEIEFRAGEGGLDRQLSVYETPRDEALKVQVFAEHSAGANLDPPRGGKLVDVHGIFDGELVVKEEGAFAFIRAAHREIHFADDARVLRLGEQILARQQQRALDVSKEQLRQYVTARLASADREWTEYFQHAPKGAKWRALAGITG
jgi:hypothetical protein